MPHHSESTSQSLIERVGNLDPHAWETFVAIYSPIVYSWGRKAGLQDSDLADVSQEVFRAVATGINGYANKGAKFRSWLWGITRNKVNDHYRAKEKHPPGRGGEAGDLVIAMPETLDDKSDSAIQIRVLHRMLELIRSDYEEHTWQAFWRTTVGNERATDIASELGMTNKAVRQAKYRILNRLRTELEGQIDL